ncbi:MAG: TraR/DksA C4-type zinc finger protein [Opitutaceae bacterium]|nr:TraR/DksA C4-type zinc finger protein [Opitutaceae bacterium]
MARHKKSAPKSASSSRKPAPSKKPSAASSAKRPSPKPSPKKPGPAKAAAEKKAPASKVPAKKAAPAPVVATPPPPPAAAPKPSPRAVEKGKAREALRSRILGAKKPSKPIAFSLDEVREIAKTIAARNPDVAQKASTANHNQKAAKLHAAKTAAKPSQPNHVKAATLADILGFNPHKPARQPADDSDIPEKFRRYYRLLIDLRNHVTGRLDLHSEDTLKRSSKDDAGDLSSYGQHMADAGTDTFDRDFALSLVSSEQEALSEIEAAIKRIKTGSYGICEVTQKPIAKERLLAVPFTRYSAEAQKEIERNRYRLRTGAGLFGEAGEEGGSISSDGGGDDE